MQSKIDSILCGEHPTKKKGGIISDLHHYLDVIEDEAENAAIFFVRKKFLAFLDEPGTEFSNKVDDYAERLYNAVSSVHENNQGIWFVVDCECHEKDECSICPIVAYAKVFRYPVVYFYTGRLFKKELDHPLLLRLPKRPSRWHPVVRLLASQAREVTWPPLRRKDDHFVPAWLADWLRWLLEWLPYLLNWLGFGIGFGIECLFTWPFMFTLVNLMSLGAVTSTLHGLWRAQGVGLINRRSPSTSEDGWGAYFRARQKDWKATAVTGALVSTAAAALLAYGKITDHAISRLFCFASIVCGMGSAAGSTAFLTSVTSDRRLREAWFQGKVFFVIALSAPSGWLRWGIVMIQATLLSTVFLTEPIFVIVVISVLVAWQLALIAAWPINGIRSPSPSPQYFDPDTTTTRDAITPLPPIEYSWNFLFPPDRCVFPLQDRKISDVESQ